MTLAEFQSSVDAALTALEWDLARARWRRGLLEEIEAIQKAFPLAGLYGVEEAPLRARLLQIAEEQQGDVTADRVPVHPVRSVPMDAITTAVARRILHIPPSIPILSLKVVPSANEVRRAVAEIAARWQHPNGAQHDEETRVVNV